MRLGISQSGAGFSMTELLVSMAVMAIIFAVSLFWLMPTIGARTLEAAVSDTVSLLEEARQLTLASKDPIPGDTIVEGSQYGVYFDTTTTPHKAYLFQGSSCAPPTSCTIKKTVDYTSVDISGLTFANNTLKNSVVFNRLTGATNNAGAITLRAKRDGKQKGIGVASQGHISTSAGLLEQGWAKKRTITLNTSTINSSLANFPILIRLNTSNITYNDFDSPTDSPTPTTRYDLKFYDADDVTPLDYEIESWNESGESIVWVRVPTLQSGTDTIYMYYGKSDVTALTNPIFPTKVWNSNSYAVWHLTNVNDSTSNNKHLIQGTNPLTEATLIGSGKKFNGTSDYLGTATEYSPAGSFSYAAWFKLQSGNNDQQRYILSRSGSFHIMGLLQWVGSSSAYPHAYLPSTDSSCFLNSCGIGQSSGGVAALGRWYFIAGVFDDVANTLTSYLFFQNVTDQYLTNTKTVNTQNMNTVNKPFVIGAMLTSGDTTPALSVLNGHVDEVRLYTTNLSYDWIKASYENQNSGSTFVTIQ